MGLQLGRSSTELLTCTDGTASCHIEVSDLDDEPRWTRSIVAAITGWTLRAIIIVDLTPFVIMEAG